MTAGLLAAAFGLSLTPVTARPVGDFLDSIGVNSAISRRGETLEKTVECARYLGLRWFRSGYEGDLPPADLIELHRQTGAKASWGFLSGGNDLPRLLKGGHELAKAGALLAFEGPNEPNNWGITYLGEAGGREKSWKPVAALQRDLYRSVKNDPQLKKYPVWGISEVGGQVDNVGLQFLTIPQGATTAMPAGTRYADFANVHNYVYHPNSPAVEDNKTWNAADPSAACKIDGLFGNHGSTWGRHYPGYSERELETLPRVTTETGAAIDGAITEEIHGKNLLSLYLAQFKRGWSHTAVYLLRDRVDEGGNQQYGFYRPDYSPRKAAVYLHNLTTILADRGAERKREKLAYEISNSHPTVHDLLLQRSDGKFMLVIWAERVTGANDVVVDFAAPNRQVRIFDPVLGAGVERTVNRARKIPLRLTDHPLMLEISR